MVTVKHLKPAHPSLMAGTANHVDETNHRGYLKHAINRPQFTSAVLQHLSFASEDQHNRTPRAAEIQGLITLVKD